MAKSKDHKIIARLLSKAAAELLLEHVDGAAFIEFPVTMDQRNVTRRGLIRNRLLVYTTPRGQRPTATAITEEGRAVLCFILADYADALMRAGYNIKAKVPTAVTNQAAILFEQHSKAPRLPSDRSGAFPSPSVASEPAPTV